LPTEPKASAAPWKPSPDSSEFQPSISAIDKLIPSRRKARIAESQLRYQEAVDQWQSVVDRIALEHDEAHLEYRIAVGRMKSIHAESVNEWEARKTEFENMVRLRNAAIDAKQAAYRALEPSAIVDYCDFVLYKSQYPDLCPKEWEMEYDPSSKQLIVDYLLPAPDDFPRIKGVKWVATRNVFEDQKLTDTARAKLYDEVVYQIILRTVHEIVSSDVAGAIHAVVINGVVNSVDRATGNDVTACILSLRAEAAQFREMNLAQVEPKTCFKSLKGVGSSKLHGLAPIPPIMTIRKDDARFVTAYGVADSLDSGVNLAAMGWEDFEHLIRELFEKEFSSNGGEVRVTQASRDGGVDAIAFDPDPIRGGKIVIQAKRYTNTVGVSAVRDLYGTVMNEGATKGVLVTTSDYGPDSYSFAQGKPLVLLSGANLLHMLEKHGHKARIDIREAKQHISSQS
jgi:restriction system protein